MAKRLKDFYGSRNHSYLLDSLSLGDENVAIPQHIEKSFKAWLEALVTVSRTAGLNASTTKEHAEEAVIRIQRALVMARASGKTKSFVRQAYLNY